MTKAVRPQISVEEIDTKCFESVNYAAVIGALGFESRSADLARRYSIRGNRSIAIGFDHANSLSYLDNRSVYERKNFEIHENVSDKVFDGLIENVFSSVVSAEISQGLPILVDVSCFNRYRLASTISSLFDLVEARGLSLHVDFFYSLANYSRPTAAPRSNEVVGPAHPRFAGWSQSGSLSTAAILGLGYEPDQALGVIEYLQASPVWALCPYSPIEEYLSAVRSANSLLIEELPPERIADYDVLRPVQIMTSVASIVQGLKFSHNVVMVPSGPKIFVLCCMLLAALDREISVWRVSQGSSILPQERSSSDYSAVLRVKIESSAYSVGGAS